MTEDKSAKSIGSHGGERPVPAHPMEQTDSAGVAEDHRSLRERLDAAETTNAALRHEISHLKSEVARLSRRMESIYSWRIALKVRKALEFLADIIKGRRAGQLSGHGRLPSGATNLESHASIELLNAHVNVDGFLSRLGEEISRQKHAGATVATHRGDLDDDHARRVERPSGKVKVGINFTGLMPGEIGGMEKYMRALVQHMPRVSMAHEFHVFLCREFMEEVEESENVRKVCVEKVSMPEETDSDLHRRVNELGIDFWLSPLLILEPLTLGIPSAYCVPDIQHEYHPELFSASVLAWREKYFRRSAEAADAILTISHFSKQTLVEKYGLPPEKVSVTWLGCSDCFTAENATKLGPFVREKYGLAEPYLLYPANTWAHKNHLTLIAGFERYAETYGAPPVLVLTGFPGDAHDEVMQTIRASKLADRVRYLGYVPGEYMPALYRGALGLVFPSIFEGFGIPLVEAMYSGCAIVAASTPTAREIAGDAALYFHPTDAAELAALLRLVIDDAAVRAALIENGKRRAALFSYENCARQTVHAIDDILQRSRLADAR